MGEEVFSTVTHSKTVHTVCYQRKIVKIWNPQWEGEPFFSLCLFHLNFHINFDTNG